jgi:hypothetical protein
MTELITTKGLDEAIVALGKAPTGMFKAMAGQMTAALSDMRIAFATKPQQATPRNALRRYVRGSGMMYVPTGKIYRMTSQQYSDQVTLQVTQPNANEIVGKINLGATYSSYLRGFYGDALNKPAWMHTDTWDSSNEIVEDKLPEATRRLDIAVQDWTKANNL